MQKKQIGALLLSTALVLSTGTAFAQQYGRPGNHARRAPTAHHRGMYEQGHQQGWYRKGGRLPPAYRGNTYVVTHWRAHHLHQPPRGYHWVRSDNGDFLLVAVTTGIIASIIAAGR